MDELKELGSNGIQTVYCHLCKILEQTKLMCTEKNQNSALCVGRGRSELSGMIEMLYIFTDVGYAFVKIHCSVSLCSFLYVYDNLKKTINKNPT